MMKRENTNGNYRVGLTFLDALCLLFIALKLTHVINWSWWVILAPIWGGILFVFVIAIILVIYENR
jgi:hypothetical protein